MPPEVRQLYQMPDIFASSADDVAPTLFQTTQFVVDGKAYSSLDDQPTEARQKDEQAIGRFAANRS